MIELALLLVAVGSAAGWWRQARILAQNRALLRDIVEGMPYGFVLWDADDRLIAWSHKVRDVYARTGPELQAGISFQDLIRRGVAMGEYPAAIGREEEFVADMSARHRATGTTECELFGDRWIRIHEKRTPSGGTIGLRTEITDLKRALAEAAASRAAVEHAAHHDPLTELPNRRLFLKTLGQTLNEIADLPAALFIDLDGFKPINDSLGHLFGDPLLRAVAVRLLEVVPPTALVARLGGDEFAVLLNGSGAASEVIAWHVVSAIALPFVIDGVHVELGASVGVARARSGDKADAFMSRADQALYASKRAGGRRVTSWTDDGLDVAA